MLITALTNICHHFQVKNFLGYEYQTDGDPCLGKPRQGQIVSNFRRGTGRHGPAPSPQMLADHADHKDGDGQQTGVFEYRRIVLGTGRTEKQTEQGVPRSTR